MEGKFQFGTRIIKDGTIYKQVLTFHYIECDEQNNIILDKLFLTEDELHTWKQAKIRFDNLRRLYGDKNES